MIDKTRLSGIISEDRVLTDESEIRQYSHDMSFVIPKEPDLIVKPESSGQIADIVSLADRNLLVPAEFPCLSPS